MTPTRAVHSPAGELLRFEPAALPPLQADGFRLPVSVTRIAPFWIAAALALAIASIVIAMWGGGA